MHLVRCRDQTRFTLEEFYANLCQRGGRWGEGAQSMIELIVKLQSSPDERQVYGLTSHNRLCLLSKDTFESDAYVIIEAPKKSLFIIECRLPETIAPWPHAYVSGRADTVGLAAQMVLSGMNFSQGWKSCENARSAQTPL